MTDFPQSLDAAIDQARTATQAALAAGYTRVQIEILIPELKPLEPAHQFLSVFEELGSGLKIFFSDAGAAALARRDWGDVPYRLSSLDVAGSRQTSTVTELVDPDDQAFLVVAPTSVEVAPVEQVCEAAGERPIVLFNPQLEDVGTVGIGYSARKLRERFLDTIEPCYYLRPLDGAAILRCYPSPWQVWLEQENGYALIAEELTKPSAETLDAIFAKALGGDKPPRRGLIAEMQRFLRALTQ
ncbi:DUF1995 family protein [Pantanalinema sp. GBBB05]|uniref:DUF1995 family protein n=1 Tax=Pantanalinema sp. GBBB05 TaxID=2604139 RepID=UPI001DDC6869|nr:DUF1995 family protein [Pantanalinema sp. GBBB05]